LRVCAFGQHQAKTLEVTVMPSLLASTDEVIE